MSHSLKLFVVAQSCVLAAAGCSSRESDVVSGAVTLDGRPLDQGLIRFIPADGSQKRVEALITAGKFTAAAPLGENRVEISAPKVTGKHKMYDVPDSPVVDMIGELLPARYNIDSELTMTVAGGEQEKSFSLTSK